jgi:hypothetical protein
MALALQLLLGLIGAALSIAVLWIFCTILLPMIFRLGRDQYRRFRERQKSN